MVDVAEFRMPSLGADMTEGTVLDWRIRPGDRVRRGDVVALVDTEKAEIEVEIFDGGVVEELVVAVGDTVPVGTVLARLRADEPAPVGVAPAPHVTPATAPEPPSLPAEPAPLPLPSPTPTPRAQPGGHPTPPVLSPLVRHAAEEAHLALSALRGSGPAGLVRRADVEAALIAAPARTRMSPRARRLAVEHGIDPDELDGAGSGPGGVVVGNDVLRVVAAGPPGRAVRPAATGRPPPTGTAPPHRPDPLPAGAGPGPAMRMRAAIAARMERSWREIPHYHVGTRVDLSGALRWMADENTRRPVERRLVPAALLLAATAAAARRVPELNGWWIDGRFRPAESVDLGVAVALRSGGLLVPTMSGAERLGLDELMSRLRDVVGRARRGRLRSSDMTDASLTVTDLGDLGVDTLHGVIHPPQVALVGFGRIHEEPWAERGMLAARPVVHATVAGDHRATDGRSAAALLSAIAELLKDPACLEPTRPT